MNTQKKHMELTIKTTPAIIPYIPETVLVSDINETKPPKIKKMIESIITKVSDTY